MTSRALVSLAALLATLLAASPAGAAPSGGYRPLSASEQSALVNNKAYIPSGLGLTDSYVQDFPPQGLEVLLCYDTAFKPLMLPKAPGAWLAAQGNGGVGTGVYLYEYPDAKAAVVRPSRRSRRSWSTGSLATACTPDRKTRPSSSRNRSASS
jgi:hypothetical protein